MSLKTPSSFESAIALVLPLGADVLRMLDTKVYYDLKALPVPPFQHKVLSEFFHQNFLSVEYAGYGITNLGALLFAKNLSSFPKLRPKAFRLIHYAGLDQDKIIKVHWGNLGYAKGFESLLHYIQKHFSAIPTLEIDLKEIADRVIDAIVTQDFADEQSGPIIEIFANRVEVSNGNSSGSLSIKNTLLFKAIHELGLHSIEILTNNSTKSHN